MLKTTASRAELRRHWKDFQKSYKIKLSFAMYLDTLAHMQAKTEADSATTSAQ